MPNLPEGVNPLPEGSRMPNFELARSDGRMMTLADFRGDNGTVLTFIHGSFCPSCMPQVQRLNRIVDDLEDHDVGMVCVAHDSVDTLYGFEASAQPPIRYPMLADSEPTLAQLFGVEHGQYGSPYAAVFYADEDGIIRYVDISPDPDCHPNLEEMLAVIAARQSL